MEQQTQQTGRSNKADFRWVEPKHYKNDIGCDCSYFELAALHGEFGRFLAEKVLSGKVVALPYIGSFGLVGVKMRLSEDEDEKGHSYSTLKVNWARTNALWERKPELRKKQFVRYTNDHSNNVIYRVEWYKRPKTSPAWRFVKVNSGLYLGQRIAKWCQSGKLMNIDIYEKRRGTQPRGKGPSKATEGKV